jgi:hypothetical protein
VACGFGPVGDDQILVRARPPTAASNKGKAMTTKSSRKRKEKWGQLVSAIKVLEQATLIAGKYVMGDLRAITPDVRDKMLANFRQRADDLIEDELRASNLLPYPGQALVAQIKARTCSNGSGKAVPT